MKRKTKIAALALLLSALNAGQYLPAQACAFSSEPTFTFSFHPDVPFTRFAAGQLGILQSTYARSYLLVAYRYLDNKPLTPEEQKGAVRLWEQRLTSTDDSCNADTTSWLKARAAVAGASKVDSIDTERAINDKDAWQRYCNCQSSAFATATDTLKQLSTKYGANSEAVTQWLKAQDEVFSDCGNPPYSDKKKPVVIPPPLPANADALLQQYRDYQIASAEFYGQQFDKARADFEKIAANATSPWKTISGYLAARAMIREASLPEPINKTLLAQAAEKLKQLSANPSYASMAEDIQKLRNYIEVRLDPQQHALTLVKEPISDYTLGELTKTIDSIVGETNDYMSADDQKKDADANYDKVPAALKSVDMLDWITTYQSSSKKAEDHAVTRWKQTHSLPWLVAAISATEATDAAAKDIESAADKVVQSGSSPARYTLLYDLNRLDLAQGKNDLVRARLDKLFASNPSDLPLGALNAFKTQRLGVSNSLDEFVKYSIQSPLGLFYESQEIPDDLQKIDQSGKSESPQKPMFTQDAGEVLDIKLPVKTLSELAHNHSVPSTLQAHLAWSTWVRALLVGDDTNARSLATYMRQFNKEKQKYIDSYLAATAPDAAKFAAVFLLLHFSSGNPNPGWGPISSDAYGDESGWWWGANPVNTSAYTQQDDQQHPAAHLNPLFITAAMKAQTKAELDKLAKVDTAPNYFAKVVLSWAKTHPTDERVPEALNWLVKATHYGLTDDKTKAYSKEAFTILHTQYKTNPWTKKTPYWY